MINSGYISVGDNGCQLISKLKAPILKELWLGNIFRTKGGTTLETRDANGYYREDGLYYKHSIFVIIL